MSNVQLQSVLTCPFCGHQALHTMPMDGCCFFHTCDTCGELIEPKAGRLLCVLFVWKRPVSADAAGFRAFITLR